MKASFSWLKMSFIRMIQPGLIDIFVVPSAERKRFSFGYRSGEGVFGLSRQRSSGSREPDRDWPGFFIVRVFQPASRGGAVGDQIDHLLLGNEAARSLMRGAGLLCLS